MSEVAPTINGLAVSRLLVNVPNKGCWYAECDVPVATPLTGRVVIKLGTLELVGTVAREQSGTFGQANYVRIIAGGASWGSELVARSYHNDAGVRASLIADDAAREAGEILGGFVPADERVGRDYVRNAGPASRTLEGAAGPGVAWWVDYAGVTHVGPRAAVSVPPTAYHVIAYNPRERTALLGLDDPGALPIGATLTEHIDVPGVVRELQLWAEGREVRALAWLGGDEGSHGRAAGLLRTIIDRATDAKLHGCYRYRVVRMAAGGDGRVELQAVRRGQGLPDIAPVSQWPGMPGLYAELQPGAEVLVQFIDGDRAAPIVTHYAGKDGAGFAPVALTIGGPTGEPAARSGDAVEVLLPPAVFTGTIGPGTGFPAAIAATGVVQWLVPKVDGVIIAGSGKVKVSS